MGLKLSIDDFGTGYSNLNYLRQFPVYKLKIDRSFVQAIPGDPDAAAITSAIIRSRRPAVVRAATGEYLAAEDALRCIEFFLLLARLTTARKTSRR